jgi:pimeloyl-ACP methyl ester carboxylesterase
MSHSSAFGQGAHKVLVLPGLFGSHSAYESMFDTADFERYQYVVMHYRGFGAAKNEPGLFTWREVVVDAVRLLDHLGWKSAHLVGHSAGALAAQMLSVASPARVSSIVSLAGLSARGQSRDPERLRLIFEAATDAAKRAAFIDAGTGKRYAPGFSRYVARLSEGQISPEALREYAADAMSTDIRAQVEGSEVPYLAVVGRSDPSNNETIARETTLRLYRRASIQVVDAGHYPMLECPALTMSLIENFHDGVHASASAS